MYDQFGYGFISLYLKASCICVHHQYCDLLYKGDDILLHAYIGVSRLRMCICFHMDWYELIQERQIMWILSDGLYGSLAENGFGIDRRLKRLKELQQCANLSINIQDI